jgi:hypothetical protein
LGEAFLEVIVAALEVVELGFGAELVLGAGLGGFCKLGHFSGELGDAAEEWGLLHLFAACLLYFCCEVFCCPHGFAAGFEGLLAGPCSDGFVLGGFCGGFGYLFGGFAQVFGQLGLVLAGFG